MTSCLHHADIIAYIMLTSPYLLHTFYLIEKETQ